MDRSDTVERARALGAEMIALCDANGDAIAAGYVQLAIDRMAVRSHATRRESDPGVSREFPRSEN